MKKTILIAAIIFAMVVPFFTYGSSDGTEKEMRGIWVSSVFNLDFPSAPTTDSEKLKDEIDRIITDCEDMGMNTIFLQVVPCSDALYKSEILPWSSYLTGVQGLAPENGFDPLEYWVKECHEKSIALHAWLNPYRITKGTLTYDKLAENHPAKLNPNMVIKHTDGNYYYNPGMPETDQYVLSVVEEILTKYDVDGIQIDDYFYPGSDFPDTGTYNQYNNGTFANIADWRRDNVNSLVKQMYDKVHAVKADAVFGVSPRGIWRNKANDAAGSATSGGESYSLDFADSLKWVKEGCIDYIAPQIYWEFGHKAADYKTLADWWSDAVRGTNVKLYIGLADYRCNDAASGSCWYNGAEIKKQMEYNKTKSEVSGEIHFRYKLISQLDSLKLKIGNQYHPDVTVELNGKVIEFADQKPLIQNGRTLVPMRTIFEEFGYEVSWDGAKEEITAKKGDNVVWMKIDANEFTSNGKTYRSDVAPDIIGERTVIPLRALSEALNCNVQWNPYQRKVSIMQVGGSGY